GEAANRGQSITGAQRAAIDRLAELGSEGLVEESFHGLPSIATTCTFDQYSYRTTEQYSVSVLVGTDSRMLIYTA
ncbi:MAG TPA: hypothetical protein VFQ65_14095, partial [Kofleriaceae bacterium]|nr:hypothetical protein [Kofleriaceae bacterium]